MEKERLFGALYEVHRIPIRDIITLKDYYPRLTSVDITNLDLEKLEASKIELEWAFDNPDYDFKALLGDTSYTNQELLGFLKIYYQNVLFISKKHSEGQFILTVDDVPE